ncbi:hypothetical protein D3C81_94920 [compost metagenome]
MEETLKRFGFASQEEFNKMVSEVDLSDLKDLIAFKDWQNNDGTKDGLGKLINRKIETSNITQHNVNDKQYENTEPVYKPGDKVDVISGWAKGQTIQIIQPSIKKNAFKGYIINTEDGSPQGNLVTVDAKDIQLQA